MTDRDVAAVLLYYALGAAAVRQIEPIGSAGGWSGAKLWRITEPNGRQFCLRRWPPEHPTRERLQMIHAVLGLVAFEMPIVAFPLRTTAGSTVVEHDDHLWELTAWRPGTANFCKQPSRDRLRNAMLALAMFHDLAARYQRRQGQAPAIEERLKRWKGLQEKGLSIIERSLALPLGNKIDALAVRLFKLAGKAVESDRTICELAVAGELWLQPAIRDIHHEHVLFTGDEVTGIIDFGALRIDTPLTDIARLIGSLIGDDRAARQYALDAYAERRPLINSDRRLIELLDETGLVLGSIHWLVWLYVERREMGPTEPIMRRLEEHVVRLESRLV